MDNEKKTIIHEYQTANCQDKSDLLTKTVPVIWGVKGEAK